MPLELTLVDAFAERAFTGNPAAVALVAGFPPDDYMQAVAGELNLPETAFVAPRDDGDHDLRWFAPLAEVDLCGHATLAAAHVLGGGARFHTASGLLECRSSLAGRIEMDFPLDPVREAPGPRLRVADVAWYGLGRVDALVVLDDAAAVRSLVPDLAQLAALGTRCVIVTAPGDRPGIDTVSRVFGPNIGIAEDPVTGSAHCTLAAYWGDRLGRDVLVGEQASRRGGVVHMRRVAGRVVLGGRAVTAGTLRLLA